jgi:hypothetical protein
MKETASVLMGLILLSLLLPTTSGITIPEEEAFTIQEKAFTDLARANPGVYENATARFNDVKINVTITPVKYASVDDLVMAVGSIVRGYAGFLETSPFYIGYLSVRLNECGKITYIWEISAFQARTAMIKGGYGELVKQFLSNGKGIYECNIPTSQAPARISHNDL